GTIPAWYQRERRALPLEQVESLIQMPSQKSFITKVKLGKAKKQNRPLPHWFRLKTDTKIRWNAKRRNWRHTKLNI
ncbi:60S ribosomal protein L39, partial [Rhizopus azygosporus]